MNNKLLKCLFIHDHKFKKVNGSYFSEGKFTDSVFRRYVNPNDRLIVISRMINTRDSRNLSEITLKNIDFRPIKGIAVSKAFSVHLLDNIKLVTHNIKNTDFIVVRLPSFVGVFTLILNIMFKKPYFIEVVGDAEQALLTAQESPNFLYKQFCIFFSHLNRFFIGNALGAVYVTKETLQKKYPNNGITCVASNVEIKIKEKELKLEDFNIKGNSFKVGLIGSFNNHYKGIKEAIKSINILQKNNYNVHLYILGSGHLLEEYKNLASTLNITDNIHFDGSLEGGEEVIKWLENMDIYIQPSYTEGLPRALIEAMSVGLPAIATDIGGIPELLPADCLIPPHNSEKLSHKISELIDSQELRFRHGCRNYITAKDYDSINLNRTRSKFWNTARKLVEENKNEKILNNC